MSLSVEQSRGIITKTFGGRSRTFRFGMRSSAILTSLVDLKKVQENDFSEAIKLTPATFLSGLLAWDEKDNEVSKDTPLDEIEQWIFEMGEENAADIIEVSEYAMGFMQRMQTINEQRKARKINENKK